MEKKMDILDISPLISPSLAVFPGDTPFSRSVALDFSSGNHLLLSSIQATLHLGAHGDAPNHYHPQGQGIDQRPLSYYLGKCQVITPKKRDQKKDDPRRLYPADVKDVPIRAKRILFSTGSFPDENHWNPDFWSLSPELVHHLADQGVILVGIDTPSVDPSDCQKLPSHQAIYQRNLAILEGLVLRQVPDGLYTLVALPLKIKDGDASPVRAVLLSDILWD